MGKWRRSRAAPTTEINVEYAAGLMKYEILIATQEAMTVIAKST